MYRRFVLAAAILFGTASASFAQKTPSPDASKPDELASQPLVYAEPATVPQAPPQDEPQKEDWTALSLAKSGLDTSMLDGIVLGKWEQPEYTRELLRVQWRSGDPMDLYVIRPQGVARPPVILYLYDYLSDTDRFRDEGWCKRATKDGFAAVGFVSAVSGQRFHAPRPLKQWFVSELQESLGASTHDVQMVLNYLTTRGDLDMKHVGMFGEGSGASIAVLAAAADPRITVLDLFNPWGDWPHWLKESPIIPEAERANYLKPEFLSKVANLDPVLYLPQLKSRSVRIEYVLDDPGTPKSAREAMLASAPKDADIVRYKDTDEHVKAWHVNGLSGWIESQLQKQMPPSPGTVMAGVAGKLP